MNGLFEAVFGVARPQSAIGKLGLLRLCAISAMSLREGTQITDFVPESRFWRILP